LDRSFSTQTKGLWHRRELHRRAKLGGMRGVRRHLGLVFGAWLVCHVGVLTITPVSMCASLAASAQEQTCTCDHSGAAECPMHHRATQSTKSSCSCRSTGDTALATLGAFLGPIAVLSPQVHLAAPLHSTNRVSFFTISLIDAPARPDSPPPRA
jgi:hypothetical protein